MKPYELNVKKLTSHCEESCLKFNSTADVEPLDGIMGQDRAIEAIEFGLKMKHRGYNIFVAGNWGTGRNSYVRLLTEKIAATKASPKDWIYANNFKNFRTPLAIGLQPGEGKAFIKNMEFIIDFLKKEIESVFSGKDYENAKTTILTEYTSETQGIIKNLNDIGERYGFRFGQNEKGLVSIPLKNGEPMTEDEYKSITDEEYEVLKENSGKLSVETADIFNQLRVEEERYRTRVAELDESMGRRIASFHLMNFREKYHDHPDIITYLDYLVDDVVEHLDRFKNEEEPEQKGPFAMFAPKNSENFFERYRLNLFIDNSETKAAPVIFASNPSYANLLGSVEYKNEMGVLRTDFTMIKPGMLHQANGGYLILLAKDIVAMPYAWKGLKRALLDENISIESLSGQGNGSVVSMTLNPQPIPLDVKVILIGDAYTYQLLYQYDEEFRKLYKIMADFDIEMNRNDENIYKVTQFIAKHVKEDHLRDFGRCAVAKIIEYSSRVADDQSKLSSHLNKLVDVLYEAEAWAEEAHSELVMAEHVDQALDSLNRRNNKVEEKVLKMFETGDYLLDVDGFKVGEINGLAVMGSGQYRFGKPSKITVSTYQGRSGLINIEREARTSGAIHDKGVMIISGYVGHMFAQNKPISVTASIVFEQLYSGVDGDSASSTELYAILSSISGVPINQSIAVTGSVNQRGEIQPIGGVNEKIEGFYKVCKLKGLTGEQGCMIPIQNVKNLMLGREVIEAVEQGKFHIYAVSHVEEGIEILMGKEAGKQLPEGGFTKGSIFDLVDTKLTELAMGTPLRPEVKNESTEEKAKDPEEIPVVDESDDEDSSDEGPSDEDPSDEGPSDEEDAKPEASKEEPVAKKTRKKKSDESSPKAKEDSGAKKKAVSSPKKSKGNGIN